MCFYYTLSGYFLYLFTGQPPSNWGIPVIILSAAVNIVMLKLLPGTRNSDKGAKPVSLRTILCCALPCCIFLFSPSLPQIIQYIPAWAFFAFAVWTDRLYTDRGAFEEHFSFSGKILLLMLLGIFVPRMLIGALTTVIPYLIIYLLTGVCVMRILREDGRLTASRNIVSLLILLSGGIVLAFIQTPYLLWTALGFFYRHIITRIFMVAIYVVGALVYGFIWVFIKLFSLFSNNAEAIPPDISGIAEGILGEDADIVIRGTPQWLKTAGIILLILAAAFVVFLILRKLLGYKPSAGKEKLYTEEKEPFHKHERKRKGGIFRPGEPGLAVRWYYRKYLKEGVSRGLKPAPEDTSLRILRKYAPVFPESEAEKLRALYIIARYRRRNGLSEADAETAADIWRALKQNIPK